MWSLFNHVSTCINCRFLTNSASFVSLFVSILPFSLYSSRPGWLCTAWGDWDQSTCGEELWALVISSLCHLGLAPVAYSLGSWICFVLDFISRVTRYIWYKMLLTHTWRPSNNEGTRRWQKWAVTRWNGSANGPTNGNLKRDWLTTATLSLVGEIEPRICFKKISIHAPTDWLHDRCHWLVPQANWADSWYICKKK